MELNKSILIILFLSSYLVLSAQADFYIPRSYLADSKQKHKHKQKYFLMKSNSPAPSPTSETPLNAPAPSPISQKTFKSRTTFKFPDFPTTSTRFNIDPKLEGICAVTENPKQCISFIAPYLKGSINAKRALKVVIQRLYVLVEEVSIIAFQIRSKASTSLATKKSIDNSLELYEKTLNNLKMALVAFYDHDLDKVNTLLGASISNFGYCNEAFDERGLKRGPMQKINDLLIEFAGYGIDISKKLVIIHN